MNCDNTDVTYENDVNELFQIIAQAVVCHYIVYGVESDYLKMRNAKSQKINPLPSKFRNDRCIIVSN